MVNNRKYITKGRRKKVFFAQNTDSQPNMGKKSAIWLAIRRKTPFFDR